MTSWHPQRSASTPKGRRVSKDTGSGLTEFVIVAPIFIILILWSEVFVDTGIVSLKMEEAARYATWEMSAQRLDTEVQDEVQYRFADLNSPKVFQQGKPSTRSFRSISMQTTIKSQAAGLTGTAPPPSAITGGGVASYLLRGISGLLGGSVNSFINNLGSRWSTKREYYASIDLTATNTLFPGGHILGIFIDAPPADRTLHFHANSPAMLVDTWKAWPGPFGYTPSSRANTDVRTTFNPTGANAVEKELSQRLNDVAFLGRAGNGSILQILGFVLQILGTLNPVSEQTWDQGGPVVSWPGATPLHSWSAGQLSHIQRVGDTVKDTGGGDDTTVNKSIRSPQIGVDRTRYTVPSRVNSRLWGAGVGGLDTSTTLGTGSGNFATKGPGFVSTVMETSTVNTDAVNPYVMLYRSDCRDGGYMGAIKLGVNRWNNASYFQTTHTRCPGSANNIPCISGWCN
jgi:hypothetical protein